LKAKWYFSVLERQERGDATVEIRFGDDKKVTEAEVVSGQTDPPDGVQGGFVSKLWNFGASREVELTVGADLRILEVNRAAAKVWGFPLDRFEGMEFTACFTNPDAARDLCALAFAKGEAQEHILELTTPAGEFSYLQCRAVRLEGEDVRVLVTAQNITERKSMPSALFESREMFRNAFECANMGIGLVDLQGRFFDVNNKLCDLLGLSRGELIGVEVKDVASPDSEMPDSDFLSKALEGDASQNAYEKCYATPERETQWVEISFGLGRGQTGKQLCVIACFRDINERKQLEAILEEQASIDPLTKALTRTSFEERANIEVSRSGRHGHKLSLLLIDLDYMRVVNDKYGFDAGDQVLSELCGVARKCLRMTDIFGRWGGEEFLVLLPDTGTAGAMRVAERIRASIERFNFPEGVQMTVSLGVTGCREEESFASVVDRADDCLFRAKQGGRNRVVIDEKDLARENAHKTDKGHFLELPWKKSYTSGNSDIDAEHRKVFQIANHIISAMTSEETGNELMSLVDDLLVELVLHFTHEEELLEAAGYPEIEAHKASHRRLLAQAVDLADGLKRMEGTARDFLGFVIHDIVSMHILQEDPEYFPWFGKTGPPVQEPVQEQGMAKSGIQGNRI
jgi:diguanylate cyclase (GGDEF)-like protein/hemerythrin-like metal-binding protein/PAS domain S-box-containing protein